VFWKPTDIIVHSEEISFHSNQDMWNFVYTDCEHT